MTLVQSPEAGRSSREGPAAPQSAFMMVFSFAAAIGYLCSLTYAMAYASYSVWGALLLIPVLFAITVPLCSMAARHANDPRLGRLLVVAFVLKMLGTLIRFAVVFDVYDGFGDSGAYDKAGRILATSFRAGHFDTGPGAVSSTHFIEVVTGVVYSVVGSTQLGGFFVFSWFGFLGLYFFYRAFALAVPHGAHRRYALLVFFLPSLLFWPSSIGKESWMTLALGLVAYGAARIFSRERGGFIFLGLGLWAANAVRPHMALLILAGLLPAYVLRKAPSRFAEKKQSLKIVGVVTLVLCIVFVLGKTEQRFGVTSADSASRTAVFDNTETSTTQGGSSFTPSRVHSPVQLPMALATVLFRPFPWEASTTQGIVSAFEGAFLILLSLRSFRRLARIPKELISTPYIVFAVIYTLAFIYAFSTIGNFGILVRERVQVYPLFVALLCLPKPILKKGTTAVRRSYVR